MKSFSKCLRPGGLAAFTLVEAMVSLAVFSLVVVGVLGAIQTTRRVQSAQTTGASLKSLARSLAVQISASGPSNLAQMNTNAGGVYTTLAARNQLLEVPMPTRASLRGSLDPRGGWLGKFRQNKVCASQYDRLKLRAGYHSIASLIAVSDYSDLDLAKTDTRLLVGKLIRRPGAISPSDIGTDSLEITGVTVGVDDMARAVPPVWGTYKVSVTIHYRDAARQSRNETAVAFSRGNL